MEALQTNDKKDDHNTALDHHGMTALEVTMQTTILNDQMKRSHLDQENDRNVSTNKDYGYEKVKQCKMQRTTTSIHHV